MLAERFDVAADVYSATSYKELRREALAAARHNRLHPDEPARVPFVTELLGQGEGPVIAASDFVKLVPDRSTDEVVLENALPHKQVFLNGQEGVQGILQGD